MENAILKLELHSENLTLRYSFLVVCIATIFLC